MMQQLKEKIQECNVEKSTFASFKRKSVMGIEQNEH